MCLITDSRKNKEFKEKHAYNDMITVWKVYHRCRGGLSSLFQFFFVSRPGVVKSNRSWKRLNQKRDGDIRRWQFGKPEYFWMVDRGIHVYTNRRIAVEVAGRDRGRVVVCCHAKMSDFVGCDDIRHEAVFTKVSISPRNFNKAVKGKGKGK